MIRNTHRVGDYLAVDDESGFTHYASEMVERWDGAFVHRDNNEFRHPQEFVYAKNDPYPVDPIRPAEKVPQACASFMLTKVGETDIDAPTGPATHIFDVGIGDMEIGCDFWVR